MLSQEAKEYFHSHRKYKRKVKRHERLKKNVFQFKEKNKRKRGEKNFQEITLRTFRIYKDMILHVQGAQQIQTWIHKT